MADTEQACAHKRGLRCDRAPSTIPPAQRLCADHRRGRPDHRLRTRHAPAHQCWSNSTWEPDPLVLDDQALVVHVRGKGLLVVTGCGHAGAVNIVRHAQRLTAVPRLHALLGGLHLSGGYFAPSIAPTVEALTAMAPVLLVPGHCTGWRAQHAFAAALPDSWVQGSSGTRYRLSAD